MANKQINELTELTTASGTDLLLVYDLNEGGSEKSKKIELYNAIGYEEGTWTPVIADATSGGNIGSAATVNGTFTKIGRQITVTADLTDINTGGMTGGASLFIQGLPYNYWALRYFGTAQFAIVAYSGDYVIASTINTGGDAILFISMNTGGAYTAVSVAQLTSGTADVRFTLTYEI